MQSLINECYEKAKQILTENQDKLELMAQTLLEVETLNADQIKSLFETGKLHEIVESEDDEEVQTTEGDKEEVKVKIQTKEADSTPKREEETYDAIYDS